MMKTIPTLGQAKKAPNPVVATRVEVFNETMDEAIKRFAKEAPKPVQRLKDLTLVG